MKTANFPGRKTERRKRALARFSFDPSRTTDEKYMARKEHEKRVLEERTR